MKRNLLSLLFCFYGCHRPITGYVLNGNQLPRADVYLFTTGGRLFTQSPIDEYGRFKLNAPMGRYTLMAKCPGYDLCYRKVYVFWPLVLHKGVTIDLIRESQSQHLSTKTSKK